MTSQLRTEARFGSFKIKSRKFDLPCDVNGNPLKISQYFGENVFDFNTSDNLSEQDKKEIQEVVNRKKELNREMAEKYSNAVLKWAIDKGATHFTHWFQPLTGSTAEKHDAFLTIKDGKPIEKLSASQLIQGEPDASSFPHGGSRSTFEARGYTSWDFSSPVFLKSSENGKTLCIPTAFVSYYGDALDIKTPHLRSLTAISKHVSKFYNLVSGSKRSQDHVTHMDVTCGCEQEYFLVDKALYFERPDLVMCGRALFGARTSRNQQLEDHYFGTIPERVLSFMQEVEVELYKLGVPAKTRHNEVAPGQFELAPVFSQSNIASDQNQLVMAELQSVAIKHDFVCLLHEKPFAGINGSGKHVNWSMSTEGGDNLLEPSKEPHKNYRFLAVVSIICEAVYRHAAPLRTAIASHSNDHRLGANEAPPSIISIFLGDTLTKILEAYAAGKDYNHSDIGALNIGADQLATLAQDNTDRNRTSPFAFTGNKFEFRAVGSSANVGIPLAVLNGAVADVFEEVNIRIEKEVAEGKEMNAILMGIVKHYYGNSQRIVFNGDGYSKEWELEAEKRGLPNLRTTPDALEIIKDKKYNQFLLNQKIYREGELTTRYNVRLERYIKHREIEFLTLISMVNKFILPAAFEYKENLANLIDAQKKISIDGKVEKEIFRVLHETTDDLYLQTQELQKAIVPEGHADEMIYAKKIANELMPLSEQIANCCNQLEEILPDDMWKLPTFFDMLFVR